MRVITQLLLVSICFWEVCGSPYTVIATPPATVFEYLRETFASIRNASPDKSLTYNVTKVCSEGVLHGLCNITRPRCISGKLCAINSTRGDGWGWILPQNERDFVATFTNGSAFRSELGVCGTRHERFIEHQVSKGKTILNRRIYNMQVAYAGVVKTIPICCGGYKETSEYRCAPSCEGNCENGDCTAPGNCTCLKGYFRNNQSRCVPTCSDGCENGDCTAPDICVCPTRYVKKTPSRCVPVCSRGCKFGYCTAPDTCTCRVGYKKHNHNPESNQCVPDCPHGCNNGKCVRPGYCECHRGYMKDITGNCISFCPSGCHNGQCIAPNECICNDGYLKDNILGNTCRHFCKDGCLNGNCTGPNQCTCNEGYTKKNSYICEKPCHWKKYTWDLYDV